MNITIDKASKVWVEARCSLHNDTILMAGPFLNENRNMEYGNSICPGNLQQERACEEHWYFRVGAQS